jgi:hypothetical protein
VLYPECLRKEQADAYVHVQMSIYFFGCKFFEAPQSAIDVLHDQDVNVAKCRHSRTD